MIYSLLEDDVGNILIETRDHGVWCYDRKTITDISGLTNFNDESIYSIKRDKPCSFWFATQSKGVWHYDARLSESVGQRKLITKFNTKVGLGNHSVFYIVAEKTGTIGLKQEVWV